MTTSNVGTNASSSTARLRREEAGDPVELVRVRRAGRTRGRGHRAEREPALPRDPQSRGRSLATAFLWRYPEIKTSILRPVSTLGYYVQHDRRVPEAAYVPTVFGFNPDDAVHPWGGRRGSDRAHAFETATRGVFNLIVGPGAVPLKVAIRNWRDRDSTLEPLARDLLSRLFRHSLTVPGHDAIDFAKYPCTIDGRRFRAATGIKPLYTLEETLRSVRLGNTNRSPWRDRRRIEKEGRQRQRCGAPVRRTKHPARRTVPRAGEEGRRRRAREPPAVAEPRRRQVKDPRREGCAAGLKSTPPR